MLQPKRTKFRKFQKGRVGGVVISQLHFGKYALQSLTSGRLPAAVIEAARRVMTRKLKRSGQIWIRVFPDIAISKKPAEVRMGKGKGSPDFWVCRVKKGQILFEIDGVPYELAKQAARLAHQKIPFQTKFLTCPSVS